MRIYERNGKKKGGKGEMETRKLRKNAGSKMCFDDIQQFVSHEISHSKQNTSSLHLSVAVLEELSKVFNPDIKLLLTDNAKSQHKWTF
ncbi:Hypothetical predicted protein [Octopus vulgaris]|uniref:Uncharacterized protein n=1 Tax=Octopus vulgaris TaxID=6645 RepID=A0AA36AZL7_OCTVU|nr:Hypothetical predicted protein [Octopus vulgaris]